MAEPVAGTLEGATPAAPIVATPASPEPTPTPSPEPAPGTKGGDEWEKRFKGIQGDLAKERKARQQYESDLKAARAEVEFERKQKQALAGINVASPEEAEIAEIQLRASKALTPDWMLKQLGLTKEEIQELKAAKQDRERLSDIERHVWGKHGETMTRQVAAKLSKEYGGELTERQIKTVTRAYVLEAQENPEFLERHESGDEKLIEEFAKAWLDDWFEPARRKITATEAGRFRPVPNGKDRSIVNHGEKKIDVKDDKQVEDLLVAGFRERGGEFGRRR